jgi:hypothetical protein
MPRDDLAHGPPAKQKAGGSHHRFSRIIRHSLRDDFNAYSALSLGTGLSCPHRSHAFVAPANLASASGGQDHTPSPYVPASFVRAANSALSIPIRPPHPALNVRDDREAPLLIECGTHGSCF